VRKAREAIPIKTARKCTSVQVRDFCNHRGVVQLLSLLAAGKPVSHAGLVRQRGFPQATQPQHWRQRGDVANGACARFQPLGHAASEPSLVRASVCSFSQYWLRARQVNAPAGASMTVSPRPASARDTRCWQALWNCHGVVAMPDGSLQGFVPSPCSSTLEPDRHASPR